MTVARETERPLTSRVARETPQAGPPESAPARGVIGRTATYLVLLPIRFYRRLISPLLGPRCRYYPTCSTYAEQAVRELGPVRGTITAAWRILRCNPFSAGGLDPLENRRLFRSGGAPTPRSPSKAPNR